MKTTVDLLARKDDGVATSDRPRTQIPRMAAACSLVILAGCTHALPTEPAKENSATTSAAIEGVTYQTWWGGSFYGSHGTMAGDVDGDKKADLVGLGDGYIGVIRSDGTTFGNYETWWPGSFYGSHG